MNEFLYQKLFINSGERWVELAFLTISKLNYWTSSKQEALNNILCRWLNIRYLALNLNNSSPNWYNDVMNIFSLDCCYENGRVPYSF